MNKEFLDEMIQMKDDTRAEHCLRFFKTGEGQYGEGDVFLGLTSPQVRSLAKKYYKLLGLSEIRELLQNKYHEVRSCALLMCVLKYDKAKAEEKTEICNFYLQNKNRINNWDLVDISAAQIVGHYVFHYGNEEVLWDLACSGHLWSERISVVSALYFIRQNEFDYILKACEHFLSHKHDLMHKATGWMLREVGKRDQETLEGFLEKNAAQMPRTMLRYAIEKFPEEQRKRYLAVGKKTK